jgi:regulator of protease activity HflC (stomatin/prohibitin superfamily)
MSAFGMILFVLGIIGLCVGLVAWFMTKTKTDDRLGKILTIVGVLAIVIGLFLQSFMIVPAGNRGVLMRFGKVEGSKSEGLNMRLPFIEDVELMSVRTQLYESEATAASKDLQDVTAKIAINYRIDPARVGYIYQTIGMNYIDVIAHPAIQETVKEITAKFNAEDMILKRSEVKDAIVGTLTTRLSQRDIITESINITNFEFSSQFTKAIEDKVVAQQNALQAQNKLEQVKVEAQQAKAKAEGEANAAIAKAEGQARAIQIVTDAQTAANTKIAPSLSEEVLQYIFYDRLGQDIRVVVIPSGSNLTLGGLTEEPTPTPAAGN